MRLPPALLAIFAVLIWPSSLACGQTSDATGALDALLQQRHYVELERALASRGSLLPPSSLAYFQGVMANRINDVQKSLRLLEPLTPTLLATSPVRAELALCTLADDYAKIFRYAKAAGLYAQANRVADKQGKSSECRADTEAAQWGLLSNAPAQTVTAHGAFSIGGKRDALGFFQVPIMSGKYSGSWVLSSGTKLSAVSRSVASKLGLEISTGSATAQAGTGLPVSIHTAVISEIRLGPALLRNVPVLVMEDSDLSFPQLDYRIEACLGLPVLAALGKVTFYHDGRINFSLGEKAPSNGIGSHNLFLETFSLLVTADLGHGEQLFTLDTASMTTVLSAAFYKEDNTIVDIAGLVKLELSGLGGPAALPAYRIPSLAVMFGGSCARVKDISLLTGPTGQPDEFYGTIGESALDSFSSFTLDLRRMHFSVNGGNPGDCTGGVTLSSKQTPKKSRYSRYQAADTGL
jgi:predicted aspartyl protease